MEPASYADGNRGEFSKVFCIVILCIENSGALIFENLSIKNAVKRKVVNLCSTAKQFTSVP